MLKTVAQWTTFGLFELRQSMPIEEVFRRDSFSDRICDDLSEVILQYLDFTDKIGLQCVSKRFSRTIFVKQYRLIVKTRNDPRVSDPNYFEDLDLATAHHQEINQFKDLGCDRLDDLITTGIVEKSGVYSFNRKAFKSILKKCRNIKSIGIQNKGLEVCDSNQIIESILKYSKHLTEVYFNFAEISVEIFQKFIDKFGKSIQTFTYYSDYYLENSYDPNLIKSIPNITRLNIINSNTLDEFIGPEFFMLRNLRKVAFWVHNYQQDIDIITILMNNNIKTLIAIDIYVYSCDTDVQHFILNQLIKMSMLKCFKLDFNTQSETNWWYRKSLHNDNIKLDDQVFRKHLRFVSNCCENIVRLEIRLESFSSICSAVYESIQYFRRLERLSLYFRYEVTDNELSYSSESLIDCQNLTHLSLDVPLIEDQFFTDIELHLPRLQCLRLSKVVIDFDPMIALLYLPRLKYVTFD